MSGRASQRIDRAGRRVLSWIAHEDAQCRTCADDELHPVRWARRHADETGHNVIIQRIRMTSIQSAADLGGQS